ncbi:MAG: hypothetical protein Q7T56_02375 [Nocardioidaceae bacterium]|nr:hypothetical protein [Nocardioidaceae bacterium]
MSGDHPDLAAARRGLTEVNDRIGAHPLRSQEFLRAREVMAAASEEDADAVDDALRRQGLPGRGRQLRMMALGLTSLARLNRKRLALEARIAELEADDAR